MVRVAGTSLLILLGVLLVACGGPSPTDTGIYGITVRSQGGFSPASSPLPGGFGESTSVPDASEAVRIKALSGEHAGTIVASLRSDGQGLFRAPLPPGQYLVFGVAEPGIAKPVTVRSGGFARVEIQTGFRF